LSALRASDPNPLLLVLAVIVITAIACQNWLFDPLGNTDAYKYVGMFLDFEHIDPAVYDYKTSRLPWILPGFLSYHLFGPLVGHYVLQMGFLSAAAVLLYFGLRIAFGRDIALVTSGILLTYSFFHGPTGFASGGWSYHNTAAITYYFGTFYCLMRAVRADRGSGAALCGGIFGGLCLFTTLFMAPFVGVVSAATLASRAPLRRSLRLVPWFLAGMVIATAALAAANMAFGRGPAFFMSEVRYIADQAHKNIYYVPLASYAGSAFWLVYPVITGAAILVSWACARLYPARFPADRRLILLLQAQFILHAVHMTVVTEVMHQSVLNFPFMVIPLAGPMALALAASLTLMQRYPRPSLSALGTQTLVPIAIVTVLVLGLRMGTPAVKEHMETWLTTHSSLMEQFAAREMPVLIPIIVGCVFLLVFPLFGIFRAGMVGVAIAFAALNLLSYPETSPVCLHRQSCCNLREAFEGVVDANRFLSRIDPKAVSNRFIFKLDEYEPDGACGQAWLTQVFISLYSTRLAGTVYDWNKLQEIPEKDVQAWSGITLVSSPMFHDEFTEALTARAASSGVILHTAGTQLVTHLPFQFVVTVFTATPTAHHQ
jgi:hypothetical protein